MCSVISRGTGGPKVLVGGDIQQKGKLQTYGLVGRPSHTNSSLPQWDMFSSLPDLLMKKTLRRVLGLFTAVILKRVSESIYFKSDKFTTCKAKDEKEGANSLMTFNLPEIIHLFQGKKHLRT